jgi:hypothetical protein
MRNEMARDHVERSRIPGVGVARLSKRGSRRYVIGRRVFTSTSFALIRASRDRYLFIQPEANDVA